MSAIAFPKPSHKRAKEKIVKIKLQKNVECFQCGCAQQIHRHHIFFGNANRAMSEKYGLTVYLCLEHHEGNTGVHYNIELDEQLREFAKSEFIKIYSEDLFFKDFKGRYCKA